jgi:hypothetical protein
MKTIIKVVVAVLVVMTCFNASRALLNDSQFEDAVHETLLFDPRASDAEIVASVMKTAGQFDVPIDPEDIAIKQVGQDVIVNMSYTQKVVLVPGVFSRDWNFTPSASARILTGSRR